MTQALEQRENTELKARKEGSEFTVETLGAYVTRLRLEEVQSPIIASIYYTDGKKRGGMFIASPFGPEGPEADAHKHGELRNLEWEILSRSVGRVGLTVDDGPIEARVTYEVDRRSFKASYSERNIGTNTLPRPVGFHPYFEMYPEDVVYDHGFFMKSGVTHESLRAAHIMGYREDPIDLELRSGSKVRLSQTGLPVPVLWTDGTRVCVEPTAAGPALADGQPPESVMLEPGQVKEYSMTIEAI